MSKPVILTIDDEPNVVRLCQRVLEPEGYQVLTATSGQQALFILGRQPVDLLMVDIRMPDMDGFQVLVEARAIQPDVAALIMTGFGTVETAIHALRQGADGLILKPFDLDELVETVVSAMQERERRREAALVHSLRPLFDVIEGFFTEKDLDRLKEVIVEAAAVHLQGSAAGFYRFSEDGSQCETLAIWGKPLPEGLYNNCWVQPAMDGAGERQPVVLVANRNEDPGIEALLNQSQLSSAICIPIRIQGKRCVLATARSAEQPPFSKADLELFHILARQASMAMENAALNAQQRSYVQQIERSKAAMDRAERIAAAGRLTASIAHEINNPLQSLSNCLHLAGRRELSAKERQRYITLSKNELDRLMLVVQRMLDFYRPGARDSQRTNLNELIQHVLMMMEPQLQKGKIEVKTELAEGMPSVMVVASQIQQVLINLILNSMEAMPRGGIITISTVYPFRETNGPEMVAIFVEDNGPGVPPEQSEQIFEPFVSTKEQGTGLGLSVSDGIISAHGGSLTLVNENGPGACFRILLPKGENA